MKRFICICLALSISLSLCACGGINPSSSANSLKSANEGDSTILKIAVLDVVGMTCSDAIQALQEAGFTNVLSNVSSDSDAESWVVTSQSVKAGKVIKSEDKIELTCAKKCKLYVDVKSENNLIFSTYEITVELDGVEIGYIPNGEGFTYLADVLSGDHSLVFFKSGSTSPKCTEKISVSGDMTFSCELAHSSSSIDPKNQKTEDNINGATLEMVDVTGIILSEALTTLGDIGFSNIREEPYSDIWNKKNWIVVKQNLPKGTIADKNEFIELSCISLDDYFSETYVGKNVNEIQKLAAESSFSLTFEDDLWNDMDEAVNEMDEAEKNDWVATKARQYGGADKTAYVIISSTKETPAPVETPAPTPNRPSSPVSTPVPTPKHTSAPKTSVSYSTNNKDTVKNGNSGIYAYRDRGGSYYVYYIIDFDEGYVYTFCEGNGSIICDRVKIVSGDLNNVLIITYHDGVDVWSYGLHFKWKNQPDILILQEEGGVEWEYYTTDLDDALALKDKKTIHDY